MSFAHPEKSKYSLCAHIIQGISINIAVRKKGNQYTSVFNLLLFFFGWVILKGGVLTAGEQPEQSINSKGILSLEESERHPPISVKFHLLKAGYVTLVIDNENNERVRNLISEQYFPAGNNTVWWDGMDDHGQQNIRTHGGYDVMGKPVQPGKFRVRGLWHDKIDLQFEFSVYCPVSPAWRTADRKGQWLSDHVPPCSVLYIPGNTPYMLLGSTMAEGSHGLVWTDLSGKKLLGVTVTGKNWSAAGKLARDDGKQRLSAIDAYAMGVGPNELHLSSVTAQGAKAIFSLPEAGGEFQISSHGGLAVQNALAAISAPHKGKIYFVSFSENAGRIQGKLAGSVSMENTRGVAFDEAGQLYILTPDSLYRCTLRINNDLVDVAETKVVFDKTLDDPREIIIGPNMEFYISEHGARHQIRIFTSQGKVFKEIGKPGKPVCGPYDEQKMHYPVGMALTPAGELWVAEEDYQPKRISIWNAKTGSFQKAFYGPTEYGGGGKIDPHDKTRFYYAGMEFALDWENGTDRIKNIFYRYDNLDNIAIESGAKGAMGTSDHSLTPETPVYLNGRQYMTNLYNGAPVNGPLVVGIWLMDNGIAKPVAAMGIASFPKFLKDPSYEAKLPIGMTLNPKLYNPYNHKPPYNQCGLFAWSDLNEDGNIQPDEVTLKKATTTGFNQADGLCFVTDDALLIKPLSFTNNGIPVYDLTKSEQFLPNGGEPLPYRQFILGNNGSFAFTGLLKIMDDFKNTNKWAGGAITGQTKEGNRWYYPNRWSGLHASQLFPTDRDPDNGELVGGTKVIGPTIIIGKDQLEAWALNANSGIIYLFTTDGMFVTSLFKHGYVAKKNTPTLPRGTVLNDFTSDGEGFYQTITQTKDGSVYLQALNHTSSIIQVKGLDTTKRLPDFSLDVTQEQILKCKEYYDIQEAFRQKQAGKSTLHAQILQQAPVVDGKLTDWTASEWVSINKESQASLAVSGERLYVAWKTTCKNLLENSGADPWIGMFKTGGALDLMISSRVPGTDNQPKNGDQRLLISKVNGKIRALLYEQVSDKKGHPGTISSPSRSVKFDYIADVSNLITVAEGQTSLSQLITVPGGRSKRLQTSSASAYEVSIPLSLLGLNIVPGLSVRGDLGILVGDGSRVLQRLYWQNKGTSQLYDAPDEAILRPSFWGEFSFVEANSQIPPLMSEKSAVIGKIDSLTNCYGVMKIDSGKVASGMACAGVDWIGTGTLSSRSIGRHGYMIFRYQPKDWWTGQKPVVNLTHPFMADPQWEKGDGLYNATQTSDVELQLDGQNCAGPNNILGGRLGDAPRLKKDQSSWNLAVNDQAVHRMTVILPYTVEQSKLTASPLDDSHHKIDLKCFNGTEGATVIQFEFCGSITLSLEQTPLGEGRNAASINAIFLD